MFYVYTGGTMLQDRNRHYSSVKGAAFRLAEMALKASVNTDGFFNVQIDRRLIIRFIYAGMKKLFEEEK